HRERHLPASRYDRGVAQAHRLRPRKRGENLARAPDRRHSFPRRVWRDLILHDWRMKRVFGLETEYGITITGTDNVDVVHESIELVRRYTDHGALMKWDY